MKRYNLIQARGDDCTLNMMGALVEAEGSDVIELGIKRGTIVSRDPTPGRDPFCRGYGPAL
jgi:hypothetical protein